MSPLISPRWSSKPRWLLRSRGRKFELTLTGLAATVFPRSLDRLAHGLRWHAYDHQCRRHRSLPNGRRRRTSQVLSRGPQIRMAVRVWSRRHGPTYGPIAWSAAGDRTVNGGTGFLGAATGKLCLPGVAHVNTPLTVSPAEAHDAFFLNEWGPIGKN